jgi:hypothetical protein
MPNYTPYTAEQAQQKRDEAYALTPEGEYAVECIPQAEIFKATRFTEDRVSKKGDPMMRLIVKTGDGSVFWDHLLFEGPMVYKIRHAAESFGILPAYENGTLTASMFVGRKGRVVIKHKEETYEGKQYKKAEIDDYVTAQGVLQEAPAAQPPGQALPPANQPTDDDIPF